MYQPGRAHRIFVSSPVHLVPPAENWANAFEKAGRALYDQDPAMFRQKCLAEHQAKMDCIAANGLGSIIHIPAHADAPDSVFTRDGSVNLAIKKNGAVTPISILAKFTNPYRQNEARMHREALESLDAGERIIVQSPFALEGGDIKLDPVRGIFWGGFHPNPSAQTACAGRTSLDAHAFITEQTGIHFCSLETSEPRYHLDTFLGVAPKGELVVCFEGMSQANKNKIMKHGFENPDLNPDQYLITVSAEEADRFATNFLGIRRLLNGAAHAPGLKDAIIMPSGIDRLASIFRERGYDVYEIPMKYIGAGGGSSHCGTNDVDVFFDWDARIAPAIA